MNKMSENNVVEENAVKYYVLVKNGRRHFDPQYLSAGMTTVQWLFPIPEANSVGTLDEHSNGIVFIKFGGYGKDPECRVIARDFCEEVYENGFFYRFSPNFSETMFAYCQTRAAVVANIKTGEAFHAGCGLSMDDYAVGIRFLDPENDLFVLAKSIDEGGSGWTDYLHISKLEGQKFVDTGWSMKIGTSDHISKNFPLYHPWFVHSNKLFVYNDGQMYCTDGTQSVIHPFSEIFNNSPYAVGNIKDLTLHPELPFGIMIEESVSGGLLHRLFAVRWDIQKAEEQVAIYGKTFEPLTGLFGFRSMALAYQSFSPDGSWYVVGCIAPHAPQNPYFIALPVSPEYPGFLGVDDIIVLGQVNGMTSLAWTSNPVSLVVSNGELLHKWDFDELPNARVFVMPEEPGDEEVKESIFRRVGKAFKGKK